MPGYEIGIGDQELGGDLLGYRGDDIGDRDI